MTFKEYGKLFLFKCLDNLASVKVWFFILPFLASTGFMGWIIANNIDFIKIVLQILGKEHPEETKAIVDSFSICVNAFTAWCTFNVALITPIIAVREIFKVQKLNALINGADEKAKEKIEKIAA